MNIYLFEGMGKFSHDRLVRMQEKETAASYATFSRYLIEEDYLQE